MNRHKRPYQATHGNKILGLTETSESPAIPVQPEIGLLSLRLFLQQYSTFVLGLQTRPFQYEVLKQKSIEYLPIVCARVVNY